MAEAVTIVAADDQADTLFALKTLLEGEHYEVFTAENGVDALRLVRERRPDLALLDVNMPGLNGYEVTQQLKSDGELRFTTVILLTARSELSEIVHGLSAGADDHIKKPYAADELRARVRAAIRLRALYKELQETIRQKEILEERVGERTRFHNIIGKSAAMQKLFTLMDRVRSSEVPVLIHGESGTGKELIAQSLHYQSPRAKAPFIAQNCGAMNDNLLESELFGHVRGAFTGALRDKRGLFEMADGGTLFLDEVGEMTPAMQVKLLRVLQEGTFTPLGGSVSKKVSVRIIAATHRDLKAMVSRGEFREDLFYRLNVLFLEVPPLRERKDDIPLLVNFLLAKKGHYRTTPEALASLLSYPWPGNVRELQNEIERACLMAGDRELIQAEDLSVSGTGSAPASAGIAEGSLKDAVVHLEKQMIAQALQKSGGNKSEAARVLGISRSNLISKVDEYNLEPAS